MPEAALIGAAWLTAILLVAGAAVAFAAFAIRRARRSPRMRALAETERDAAGDALVRLDDAVEDLDVHVALTGPRFAADAPLALRRARMSARHARDDAIATYGALVLDAPPATQLRRRATELRGRAAEGLAHVERARAELATWSAEHVPLAQRIAAVRAHAADVRATMGDAPEALLAELRARFDESERGDAAEAAAGARAALDDAARLAAVAQEHDDAAPLVDAERRLRTAAADARALEETHRLVLQAARNVAREVDAARAALRHALALRPELAPHDAARLDDVVREVTAEVDRAAGEAERRPTAAVDTLARLRERLDDALADAPTAQQRLRSARTALPGTLAAARAALARCERRPPGGAKTRATLASAQNALARAREATDPVEALEAARRALRLADAVLAEPSAPALS